MPYIKKDRREVVDSFEGQYGDLVYYYYKLALECWKAHPTFGRYFQMRYVLPSRVHPGKVDADIQSALINSRTCGLKVPSTLLDIEFAASWAYDCAIDELKRRHVDKYEDEKMMENGDVL